MTLLDPTAPPVVDSPDAREHGLLRARAALLRDVAADVEPILARSIRRRASELELEAWVLELRATRLPDGGVPAVP